MFEFHPLFDPVEYPVTEVNGVRHYNIDGAVYPSVTTVLGATSDKTHLIKWAERLRKEGKDPDAEKNRAANRGKLLHSRIEAYLLNKPTDNIGDNQTSILFNQIRMHLNQLRKIQLQETILYSKLLGEAGRVDLVADDMIIDFKTANRIKKDEWLLDYKLQVSTYAMMLMEAGYKITKFRIILTSENFGAQIVNGDATQYFKQVIERKRTYDRLAGEGQMGSSC